MDESRLHARLAGWSRMGGIAVAGLALAELLMLAGDRGIRLPGLGLLAAGCALGLLAPADVSRRGRGAGGTLAAVTTVVGLIALVEPLAVGPNAAAGRIGAAAAFALLQLGIALVVLSTSPRAPGAFQLPAAVTQVLATLALIGHAFGARALFEAGPFAGMSVFTAAALWLCSLGIITARPGAGLMRVVSSDTSGGHLMRRLLPLIPVTLFAVGTLSLLGARAGYLESALSFALLVLLSMILTTVLVAWQGRELYQTDLARRRADLAKQATEARWRGVFEAAVDGIIVIDSRGHIEAFNPAAERLFGYREQEVLGKNVSLLMPSPDREQHDTYIARYLDTGVQKIIGIGREVNARRRDGQTFPVHLAVGEIRVHGERHFTGILHDLTSRVALEEQLRERTALARLGEMAAVIAHEVKNPLAAVRGAVQVIGRRLPEGSREAPVVKDIVARLDALNDLIKDLLLFARTPQPKLMPVEIAPLIALTADLLTKDPALAGVRVHVSGTAPPLPGDPELLKIAFQNLLLNAAQAMHGQGVIRVSVSAEDGTERITIADEGPGIAPDVRQQLFRPFFTTKARGTGLGLATAKRLVELHGGTISVECPPEGGTAVTVALNQGAEAGSPPGAGASPNAHPSGAAVSPAAPGRSGSA
jgi:two-component system sensor kinase FixL